MYCIKCGVKLADTEKICPLCETMVFHPHLTQGEGDALFPQYRHQGTKKKGYLLQFFMSFCVLFAMIIVFLCDIQINRAVTWSGYVLGGLVLGYICIILPLWFKKPNAIILVPVDFVVAGTYLLYINLYTGGHWFLSFAFPVVGGIGLLVTAFTVLIKYLKRGKLFVVGGLLVSLGAFMLLVEFLLNITFKVGHFLQWSQYPLVSLAMVGGFLIFLGAYRPAREMMERKFFI